jgi:hypothetical protein
MPLTVLQPELLVRLCVREDFLQSGIALCLLRGVCRSLRDAVNGEIPAQAWNNYRRLWDTQIGGKADKLKKLLAQAACAAAMPSLALYHGGERAPSQEDVQLLGWKPTEARLQMHASLHYYATETTNYGAGSLEALGRYKGVLGKLVFGGLLYAFNRIAHNRNEQVALFEWAAAELVLSISQRDALLWSVSKHQALHERLRKTLDAPPILTVTEGRRNGKRKLPVSFAVPGGAMTCSLLRPLLPQSTDQSIAAPRREGCNSFR